MTKYQQNLLQALRAHWQSAKQIRSIMVEDGVIAPNYPLKELESHLIALTPSVTGMARRILRNQRGRIRGNLFRLVTVAELERAESRRGTQ